ncbi:lipase maturation factor family protein [Aggregicoccus sp. 17bor-14]|uniref:lipase maturation factor family protein n=1 Tax=Myxococcaceae TaxID=31 RepID=UPI00129C7955|nr:MULTISPECIES: lipase maturation factor family protein [Myxococcaceae]MBF5045169.1 lipase maturation factor family protein [Simulacricoccus sp. 17bor-14]MRI90910.1 lipase maturation factor family protein [Aggregicoccus sp. 17bor-14]
MPPSTQLTRSLYLRALGLVFLCAFASLAVQVDGLIGSHGIAPAERLFAFAHAQLTFAQLPSVFWLGASDAALHAACWGGAALSVLLVAGVAPRPVLVALWALYLSLMGAGSVFLQFQWDALLVETAALSVLFAPWSWRLRHDRPQTENRAGLWLLRLLLFRLMFSSGLVKLLSGDPTWRSFRAMDFHYWTQPLPGPLSAFAHFQPRGVHTAEAVAMFLVELVVPFFIFAPRRLRLAAFVPLAGLQGMILTTGNYGFFNLLTLVLCLTLLDDAALQRFLPRGLLQPAAPPRPAPRWRRVSAGVLAALLAALGVGELVERVGVGPFVPERARGLGLVSSYGLFAVMTTTRSEILLEGSADGTAWRPYEFRYKPGRLDRTPPLLLGHMPRLDWMMWFAALGDCGSSRWLLELQAGLLGGDSAAASLFAANPFPTAPPRYLRTTAWQYRFSTPAERREGAPFWSREPAGPFCPELQLVDGHLEEVEP